MIQLDTVEQLRDATPKWNDLWRRSDVTAPTVRAELVAQWLEQFAPRGRFQALVVEDQGQWVAALPLVENPNSGVLRTGRLTSNEWSSSGDLLLDPDAAADAVLDLLVAAMRKVPWRMLWLNEVPLDAPRWKALGQALDRAGMASDCHGRTQVGLIELGDDWEAFKRSLTKKHCVKMARCDRRLAEKGDLRLEVISQPDAEQLEHCLRKAFEIENRSWKGAVGTSVLRSPGMFEFFARQARQLAKWGLLELALLYSGEKPVAFSYGYAAKGVSHWLKIGYDPEFASCTPGQLLQSHLLERFHSEPKRRAVDTLGPLTDALAKWNPTVYRLGRITIATHSLIGRPLLYAGRYSLPLLRRLRRVNGNDPVRARKGRELSGLGPGRTHQRDRAAVSPKFRRGQIVEVRSQDEILATLDADGKLEGLPFQSEMLKFCGRTFPVFRRAEKVFLDHHYYVAKLDNTVLLDGPRCNGQAHDGCQMGCLILWKQAWLKPAIQGGSGTKRGRSILQQQTNRSYPFLSRQGDRYCCQAVELAEATRRLAWWDVRQYVRDCTSGEMTLRQVARMFTLLACNKLRRLLGGAPVGEVCGEQKRTPALCLDLQPGDLVEVKTRDEIEATLDANGKNRGLGFGMLDFCGKRYRVASRVDKLILEWSGEMRKLTDTVALEDVLCDGLDKRGCPRACYHLWREIWLKPVPHPPTAPGGDDAQADEAELPGLPASVTGEKPMDLAPPVGEAS